MISFDMSHLHATCDAADCEVTIKAQGRWGECMPELRDRGWRVSAADSEAKRRVLCAVHARRQKEIS